MGVEISWGLGQGNNALASFQQGAQIGQQAMQARAQREQQNALLKQRNEEFDYNRQKQQEEQQQRELDRHRSDIPIMARLLDHATDETTFQQARQAAAQYGIDLNGVPTSYDPNWVGQQKMLLQAVQTKEGQQAASNAGKQAIDMGLKPGTPEFANTVHQLIIADLSKPYTGAQGETRLYTPQIGGPGQVQGGTQGPQPGHVEDGYVFKGGDPADPHSWAPASHGGPTQPASGTFR